MACSRPLYQHAAHQIFYSSLSACVAPDNASAIEASNSDVFVIVIIVVFVVAIKATETILERANH